MKQITITTRTGTYTYKSISEAWRELSPKGLPEITVRWRLRHGWEASLAFMTPPIPPKERRVYNKNEPHLLKEN